MLLSGTTCHLSARNCIDSEGGYTFWKPVPTDTCHFNKYGVLYESLANKMIYRDTLLQRRNLERQTLKFESIRIRYPLQNSHRMTSRLI